MESPSPLLTRRNMLIRALAICLVPGATGAVASGLRDSTLKTRLADLDKRSGGRLGVAILNTATGNLVSHRGNERFPMCSTFKASAAALVLHRVDQGHESLDRRIVFTENDILSHAPVTKQHVGGDGMSVAELCEAALTQSDNTAANLLLASFGGPPALTHFWRSIGDSVTRADRKEPELNDIEPGDPRDTTTPIAMLHDLQKFVLGPVLKPASREQLTKWMVGNKTGDARLRAGIPRDWIGADRTGSGDRNTANDIAVIWPPRGKPILVTAFLTYGPASDEVRNKILADIGRAVAEDFSPDTARR